MFFVTPSETLGLSSLNACRAADERLLTGSTCSSAFDLCCARVLGPGALLQHRFPLPKVIKCFLSCSLFDIIAASLPRGWMFLFSEGQIL